MIGYWHSLVYLLRHKWLVFVECCRLGIPWLGIIHDLSKFLPDEFIAYTRYFYGDYPTWDEVKRMPMFVKTKESVKNDFNRAWLEHQHRNKHHFQHWILHGDDGGVWTITMPHKYLLEMVADWKGASRIAGGNGRVWYEKHKEQTLLTPEQRQEFEELLCYRN